MSKAKGNIGVERVVLAGLCQYGKDAYYDVSDIISPNTFSLDSNQALYKCLDKLFTQIDKPDATSIMACADSLGLSDLLTKNKVDIDYIRSLFHFPIKLENVRPHAKQLAKIEIIRREQAALYHAQRALDDFDGTESVSEILGVGESAVFDLVNELNSTNEEAPQQIMAGAKERLDELAKNPIENIGIPTPFKIYNKIIGRGLRPGVALWAARPKTGKSTTAKEVGTHIAKVVGVPTLYVDTEMDKKEQEDRIISSVAQVDIELIEDGHFIDYNGYQDKIHEAIESMSGIPFYHKRVGGMAFEEILSIIRRWVYQTVGFDEFGKAKPHVILYDYFKLMNESGLDKMQEYQAIGFQISHLSDFCKKYGTACMAFVQVNRDGITKDSSDIISMSDRLLWLCTSAVVFKRLTAEEIAENGGSRYGNMRLSLLETRFGQRLNDGDYILFNMDGNKATLTEVGTKYELAKQRINSGFEIEDDKPREGDGASGGDS